MASRGGRISAVPGFSGRPAWGLGLAVAMALFAPTRHAMAEPLRWHAPDTDIEKGLESFVRTFYRDIASDDPEVRRAAFRSVLVSRKDLVRLVGPDAELVWPEIEAKIEEILADPPLMRGRSRRNGYVDNVLTTVEIVDVREQPRYAKWAALIPAGIPAFKVITSFREGQPDAMSGPYLRMDGRWIWLCGAEELPRALARLKREATRKRRRDDEPPVQER